MNKLYIDKYFNIIDQIKYNSIIKITKDGQSLKFKMTEGIDAPFELLCLDEEDTIWDDGDTIEEIKESLMCSVIKNRLQDIIIINS